MPALTRPTAMVTIPMFPASSFFQEKCRKM
jgi:hypothetical protein